MVCKKKYFSTLTTNIVDSIKKVLTMIELDTNATWVL